MPTDDEKVTMENLDNWRHLFEKWPSMPTLYEIFDVQPIPIDDPDYVPIDKDGRAHQEPWPSFPGDPGHPPYFRYRHAPTGIRVLSDVAIFGKLLIKADGKDESDAT